jgi:hypothetical protein
MVKKYLAIILILIAAAGIPGTAHAQCSMCTKTASQLGEKPALGLNNGIMYLMLTPFVIIGFIGYRWWKNQPAEPEGEVKENN